jgi:hypothetical protein
MPFPVPCSCSVLTSHIVMVHAIVVPSPVPHTHSIHTFCSRNLKIQPDPFFLALTIQEQWHDKPHAKHFNTGARLKSKKSSCLCDGSLFHEIRYLTIVMWENSMLQPPHSQTRRRDHLQSTANHWHPPCQNEWVLQATGSTPMSIKLL